MRRGLAVALIMAWAAQTYADGTVALRFWHSFVGAEARVITRLTKAFAADNKVRVDTRSVDWTIYCSKLRASFLIPDAPDVSILHTSDLDSFVRDGSLAPLDDLVAPDLQADLFAPAWQAVAFGGKHYGLPLNVEVFGLYCNTRLFRAVGVAPPDTRQAFLDALPLLGDVKGVAPFSFTWLRANVASIMVQQGGAFFSDDGSLCTLNAPANIEALTFCRDLVSQGCAPVPVNGDAWLSFMKGKVACVFEGSRRVRDVEMSKKFQVEVVPMPALGGRAATWAESHVLCVRSGLNQERRMTAQAFLKHLSDHSLEWLDSGQFSARTSQLASERVTGDVTLAPFLAQLPNVFFFPASQRFQAEFDAAVEDAMLGNATPQATLERATINVNATISTYP